MNLIRAAACAFAALLWLAPSATVAQSKTEAVAGATRAPGGPITEPIELLLSEREARFFRALESPKTRERFVERFWKTREPAARERWNRRLLLAGSEFSDFDSDRARLFLIVGPPLYRLANICPTPVLEHEVWHYAEDGSSTVVFVAIGGEWRRWQPGDWQALLEDAGGRSAREEILRCERGAELVAALENTTASSPELKPGDDGWVDEFLTETTLLPDGAERFEASVDLDFPEAVGEETAVELNLRIPGYQPEPGAAPAATRAMLLTGVVLGEAEVDDFRFLYSGTAAGEEVVRLNARRHLAPGHYRMVLKLHDLARNHFYRTEREFDVPTVVAKDESPSPAKPERQLFKILPPPDGYLIGTRRFDTITAGTSVSKVRFFLDGQLVMTKNRKPFSLELDLGPMPRPRTVEAVAFDAQGTELARDRIAVNSGPHRFAIRLISPRSGSASRPGLSVHAEVDTPLGEELSHVDLFWNERLVARLYQAPFVHTFDPSETPASAYLRAVAVLEDGHSAEDLVVLNTKSTVDAIEVAFVEIYASVLDPQGEAIEGLAREDFGVFEDGVAQEIRRFETVDNLPINAVVVLDSSESMIEEIEEVEKAAASFFESVLEPKDRAAVIVFSDTPVLRVSLTNNLAHLNNGLAGIEASGETSLYDTLIYGLYYMAGLRGKRALILLSDGADSVSEFSFDDALDYARRSGVAIYTIGLGLSNRDVEAQSILRRLAHETGGESFSIPNTRKLDRIYAQIERELRSQYLLGYQSPQIERGEFRQIRVEVAGEGLEVKHPPGYYP